MWLDWVGHAPVGPRPEIGQGTADAALQRFIGYGFSECRSVFRLPRSISERSQTRDHVLGSLFVFGLPRLSPLLVHEAIAEGFFGLELVVRPAPEPEIRCRRLAAFCDGLDVIELEELP